MSGEPLTFEVSDMQGLDGLAHRGLIPTVGEGPPYTHSESALKRFECNVTVTVDASSEDEARQLARTIVTDALAQRDDKH